MPLFGLDEDGKLFSRKHPGWHDAEKPAGGTPLLKSSTTGFGYHGTPDWWWPIVSLQALFYSPNLVWLVISAAMYIAVPYNLEADGGPKDGWAASWMLPRFYLNCGVTMAYVGYWYLSLYHLSFSELKFKPQNSPGFGRMVHNMWYTFLGAVQWSAWEVIFMRLWATGTLPYVKDATTLTDPVLLAKMLFWVASIPVFREFHFYWAHRMLHFRVLYRFVHSLHHRNVDPEPFSGLCMHPVEHLYYLATVLPSIVFTLSPFHFLWNGIHAVISPAAGHSGWEDHWQSDQFHYIHHAKFECNYGGGGIPVDKFFGTLRDTLSGQDQLYRGGASGASDAAAQIKEAGSNESAYKSPAYSGNKTSQSKGGQGRRYSMPALSSLNPLPKFADGCYMLGYLSVFAALGLTLACEHSLDLGGKGGTQHLYGGTPFQQCQRLSIAEIRGLDYRTVVPLLVAWGPVVWGVLLNALLKDKFSVLWPFHKDPLLRTLGHFAVGTVFCQLVVFQSLAMYFQSPYTLPTPVLSGMA